MITANVKMPVRTTARALGLVAGLLAGTLGTAYAATPSDDVPSVVVSYGDLNLATEQGTLALYNRIIHAASQVCPQSDMRNLAGVAASKSCQSQAVARAVRDVHSAQLAALHADRSRRG